MHCFNFFFLLKKLNVISCLYFWLNFFHMFNSNEQVATASMDAIKNIACSSGGMVRKWVLESSDCDKHKLIYWSHGHCPFGQNSLCRKLSFQPMTMKLHISEIWLLDVHRWYGCRYNAVLLMVVAMQSMHIIYFHVLFQ